MAYRFTQARRGALLKARRKWRRMSPTSRQKAMPARVAHPRKVYPVGSYMMLDVGRPKGHYQFVQKTKYGWKKARAPRRLLKAGWKQTGRGYVYRRR